jgi:hypothetical protein
VKGVIMDESPTGCWTNHHSLLEYKNQWYLFYHHNDLSPNFDKNRSVRIDSLSFAPDGSIRKVQPTLRGVGLTDARQKIQLDRYSRLSASGATIAFLDTANKFQGWKTVLANNQAWVQYNAVAFGKQTLKTATMRVAAPSGGTVQIQVDGATGPVLAQVAVPKGSQWQEIKAPLTAFKPGTHTLVVSAKTNTPVEIDWVKFE